MNQIHGNSFRSYRRRVRRLNLLLVFPTTKGEYLRSEDFILRVYRAGPNPLISHDQDFPSQNYLRPPVVEKNFLISPPGSPPVGWEAIKEDPPNMTPLADDLIEALRKLQVQQRRKSSFEVLLEPNKESGVGVYVEDCDLVDYALLLQVKLSHR